MENWKCHCDVISTLSKWFSWAQLCVIPEMRVTFYWSMCLHKKLTTQQAFTVKWPVEASVQLCSAPVNQTMMLYPSCGDGLMWLQSKHMRTHSPSLVL